MSEKIVAICPTLERLDLVRQLVKSFRETSVGLEPAPELVMVVEGPDDGTEGWCRNQGLQVIRSAEALPFAKANNLAAKDVQADWLLLVNNDVILQPGFFAGLEDMAAHQFDIVGTKLLYPDGKIQHYGGMFTLDCYPFHVLRFQPADHEKAQQPRACPWVTGACLAIRKPLWDELKGFDEGYVNGFEDVDLCLRAREIGAQLGVHPKMLATHLESQTTGHDTANKESQWARFCAQWVESGRIQWPLGVWQGWRQ